MKKIFFLLSLMTIFIVLLNSELRGSDCQTDCPEIEPAIHGTTPFTYNGCQFLAYWRYRYLDCEGFDPPFCEFRLMKIQYLSGPTPCWQYGDGFDISQEAMKAILLAEGYNTPCGQNLQNGQCASEFSFTWGACWVWVFDDPHQQTHPTSLEQCQWIKHICCRSVWKICLDKLGNKVVTKLANLGLNPVCPYDKEDPPERRCFAICEEELPLPSPSSMTENSNNESGFKTFVFPNPSSDIINIRLISNTDGEHQIEVFDIGGNLIMTQSITKQQNEELIQLKMGNYPNGSYNYVIKHNGLPCINGSYKLLK